MRQCLRSTAYTNQISATIPWHERLKTHPKASVNHYGCEFVYSIKCYLMEHQKSAHSLAPLCFAPLAIFCGQSVHADSPRKISSMTTGESSLLLHFGFLDGPRRLATVSKVPRSIALYFFVLLLKYIFPYKAIKKTIG